MVSSGVVNGNDFWCPACGAEHERIEKLEPARRRAAQPQSDIARPSMLTWEGKLHPDGSISFFCQGTGSPSDARDMDDAVSFLALAGEERQRALRGEDRWTFRQNHSGTYFARIMGQEAALVPWRCGGRRERGPRPVWAPLRRTGYTPPPERCDACKADLVKGSEGYRAEDKASDGLATSVDWRRVRFCAACVRAAPKTEAGARPALRGIDGGRAKKSV
jgi:hypothetical protein